MIFAIDPGNTVSAYAVLDADLRPMQFDIVDNAVLLDMLYTYAGADTDFVIEMVASYGMAVGETVFETVFWIGRFYEAAQAFRSRNRIKRMAVKLHLCHDSRARDSNIKQALIDRFGVVGTKKEPGWFYGVRRDIWQAIAVGVTFGNSGTELAVKDFMSDAGSGECGRYKAAVYKKHGR